VRQAWLRRKASFDDYRPVRFAVAASLPALAVLSFAATARNIYLAPALPGAALLLAWWAQQTLDGADRWDIRAMRATSVLLLLGVAVFAAALAVSGADAWHTMTSHAGFILISAAGLIAAGLLAWHAWTAARDRPQPAQWALLLAYCALLVGPASQLYARVDAWQDLASIARAVERDAAGKPLILFAPDETTRAIIDMYSRTDVALIPGPIDATAIGRLGAGALAAPQSLILAQEPGRAGSITQRSDAEPGLPWREAAGLRVVRSYALPNGRRYALLELNR
jgi:hypothetical protein